MGASSNNKKNNVYDSELGSSEMPRMNIKSIKRVNPDDDIKIPEQKEDKNKKKLEELNANDDFDLNRPEYHEYMFFSVKNGDKAKNNNLDVLLKSTKKKKKQKQLYTFTKEEDTRKNNELAQILHIQYDLDKPKLPYSIKKIKCDKPPVNNNYLVIEYNMNKAGNNEDDDEDEEEENESEDKVKNILNKKYVLTSRVVHTNNKNCKISNYVYTPQNGERYDYLDINKDTDQVRKLQLKKDADEEKRVNEKEENQDRFINKQKKGEFRCKKMV